MTNRWTASINYLLVDARVASKSFHFEDMEHLSEDLEDIMEREKISWHSLVGPIHIQYNNQLDNKPISIAQLFFEGDIEQSGMAH